MSSGESDERPQQEEPPNAWTSTPPAPTFPPPYPSDPSAQPPAEGQPPYGYGAPGYPPQDFGAHQPPQFPGAQEYGGFPQYPNGYDAQQQQEAEPPYEGETEHTQYVEQQPQPQQPTEAVRTEGGYPGYPPYTEQQQYVQEGQYSSPQYFPPQQQQVPEQGGPYGEQPYQQQPYPQQQYAPQQQQQQQGYPPQQQYGEQGPPLAPLPDAYAPQQQQNPGQTSDSLSAEMLLRGRRNAPAGGWRRALYKASGGAIHPGESSNELRRRELLARARTPVAGGHHRVAVMSLKGGVGKTTTTVGLGATLASMRGDRVIAVDANPDRGTLSDKVRLETATTVRDLLNEHRQIQRYADVRAYTSQASSRLEVLASDRDPAVSEAFSEEDYRTVAHVLEHFYSICLTDCGTGLLHSAMAGVLGLANQLVLVSSPSVDGARSASATLDWLEAHHYGDLVRGGVVVLSMVRSRSRSTVDLDRLQAHFESRCRAVVRIPYDSHLEEGAEVELEQLAPGTQDAYLALAATVADGFAWPR
jgi:MinD-like ATPase involved in chromosome partitioning or flagellar assembly